MQALLSPRKCLEALFLLGAALLAAQTGQRGRVRNPHGDLDIPCQNCHTTTSWQPIRAVPEFNHNTETSYPLRGGHESVRCTDCHRSMAFKNVGVECADCHADIHRQQFGQRCQECHTVRGWREAVQLLRDHRNRFPLLGSHAAVQCESCHTGAAAGVYVGLSTECITCHQSDFQRPKSPDHVGANLPVQCEQCHTFDQWQNAKFDHARFTNFPLLGAHAQTECTQCHVGGLFSGLSPDCFACHSREFNSAQNPSHVAAGFPHDCSVCHTSSNWQGASFDHNTFTTFALTGAHAQKQCVDCHIAGQFAGTARDCWGCHSADFQRVKNPDHVGSKFPQQCEACHTTAQWAGAQFDHGLSRFPLTGAHTAAECSQCHSNGQFAGIGTECVTCHLEDYRGAQKPEHASAGFPQTCEACHTTTQWQGAVFDHSRTGFQLTGAHGSVECTQCHQGGVYTGTPSDCAGCHLANFNATTDPNHAAAGFPQTCQACHNTTSWSGAVFDHNTTTSFALTGKHVGVSCSQCHVNEAFAGTARDCVGCHLSDYNHTSDPNHVAAGFPRNCQTCHTTVQWEGAQFDHNLTQFPLTGAHAQQTCTECHVNGQFTGTPTACIGCHLDNFNKTANPNHVAAGFPQTCENCHNTTNWQGATFNHNTATQFPLTGAHTQQTCTECHVNGQFTGTPTACIGCHLDNFNKTANPNHVAAGFPQDCSLCHSTSAWQGAQFDHAQTQFPLTGKHVQQECSQCHASGQFNGLGTQCDSCHLDAYNTTQNPAHSAAGFPLNCSLCHSTSAWPGAVFDHNQTNFPLTGAHKTAPKCMDCHVNNQFAGTPTGCYSCHQTEYNNVANPNHQAAGFPTTCQSCHTTVQWEGAQFNHQFPIYSGAHKQEKWQTCNTCHPNGANFSVFNCLNCHEHSKTKMDAEHKNRSGYVYNSLNCLSCHPNGKS